MRPAALTTPLTTSVLTRLADLHHGIIGRAKVRFRRPDDGEKIHAGILRHYTGNEADVRDRQVRITMTSPGWAGADLHLPVAEILDLMDTGAFAITGPDPF